MTLDREATEHSQGSEGYTSPMGLAARLKKPQMQLDIVPVLDLVVIALLMSLVFTRFVIVPGVRVDLPATDLRLQHSADPVAVLTIQNRGMLFFDGSVYALDTINNAFRSYIADSGREDVVLLMKAEATMPLQEFLDICEMAERAGFSQVQLAGKKVEVSEGLIPEESSESRGLFEPAM